MKLLTIMTMAGLCIGAAPAFAQSSQLDRANARDERSIDYRQAHCPTGREAACDRANAKTERAIDNRTRVATADQRDPNLAIARANAKDERSIAYRNANCPPERKAACERANAKTKRAIVNRSN